MGWKSSPITDIRVLNRNAKFTSLEVTERIHFKEVAKVTKNRVIKTLHTGFNQFWDGQSMTILKCIQLAFPVRFITVTSDGYFIFKADRLVGDSAVDFLQEMTPAIKLASPDWEQILRELSSLNDYPTYYDTHVYSPSLRIISAEVFSATFKKHFTFNPEVIDEAVKLIEQNKTLTFTREYPLNSFNDKQTQT